MMQDVTLLQAGLGLIFFFGLAWAISESRRQVKVRQVLMSLIAQVVLAYLALHVEPVRQTLLRLSQGIAAIKSATQAGTSFAFGYLGGGPLPFDVNPAGNTFIFALQALPMIIVVSALSMLLFHWQVLPRLVQCISFVLRRTLHIGGALGLCTAAKMFLGATEAPLLIRPYMAKFTRSELFTVMVLGMTTTASTVMVIYATILQDTITDPISHILTSSLISLPAAIAISRIMIPHTGPDTDGELVSPYQFSGSMEAVSRGASDGMKLYVGILTMLIAMLALVALLNSILGIVVIHDAPLTLQMLLGWGFAPFAWLMGIPWNEAIVAGNLLGVKLSLNEVLAFIQLSQIDHAVLSEHTRLMMMYALCGFANFSSVGMQIGGIGNMVPERRKEIIELGFRALLAGTIANMVSATVVGLVTRLA